MSTHNTLPWRNKKKNLPDTRSMPKALPMNTQNICFHEEIRKIICGYPSYLELCCNTTPHHGAQE